MIVLFWVVVGFICGALPFAVWLPRLIAGADVRRYGDGNPGAFNAWKAGGWHTGLPVLLLDFFKGALPVGLAHYTGELNGWSLALAGLAPVIGHAFSPFLAWHGGKGMTVTVGVWTALSMPLGPIVLGLGLTIFHRLHLPDGVDVLLAMLALLACLILLGYDLSLLMAWTANTALLMWKYRPDRSLRTHPQADRQ